MARRWIENELLIAMNVYCKLPFGKLSQHNLLIIEVAERMNRTPSSVSMKLCNLASFDPALLARGVKGLTGASRADRAMWDAFQSDWNTMSASSEAAFEALMGINDENIGIEEWGFARPDGASEIVVTVSMRRHQTFFRNAVLASYESRCAVSQIAIPSLLNASHIIPWSTCEERRTDPTNGLCLHALYDRAFDRGLITFDDDNRLVISDLLRSGNIPEAQQANFVDMEGAHLHLPHRFSPDSHAMEWHRNNIFQS